MARGASLDNLPCGVGGEGGGRGAAAASVRDARRRVHAAGNGSGCPRGQLRGRNGRWSSEVDVALRMVYWGRPA